MRTKAELEKELETAKDLSPTARAARKAKEDVCAACRGKHQKHTCGKQKKLPPVPQGPAAPREASRTTRAESGAESGGAEARRAGKRRRGDGKKEPERAKRRKQAEPAAGAKKGRKRREPEPAQRAAKCVAAAPPHCIAHRPTLLRVLRAAPLRTPSTRERVTVKRDGFVDITKPGISFAQPKGGISSGNFIK